MNYVKMHFAAILAIVFLSLAAAHAANDVAVCSASDAGGTSCTAAQLKSNINEELSALNGRAPVVLTGITGTNTIEATSTPAPTALVDGTIVQIKPAATNTSTVTFNYGGLGAKQVVSAAGAALGSGDLQSTTLYIMRYYATNDEWRVLTPLGTGVASASSAYVTIGNTASLSSERSLTAGTALGLTDGGANSTITVSLTDADLTCIAALTTAANKIAYYTGSGTCALTDFSTFIRTLIDDADAATAQATLGLVIGTNIQAYDADLAALAANSTTGFWAYTGAGTGSARTFTAPAAGFTITNPAGVAGNPTFVLANDLAAYEGLAANGIVARTATDAAAARTITGTASEITATNGDGVAGNPTLSLPSALTFTGKTVTGGTFSGPAITTPGAGMTFNGLTSGSTTLAATAVAGTTALTLPAATDTLVGRATTDTLTNKSLNLANNTLTATSAQLRTALSDELGTGVLFFLGAPAADDQVFVSSSTSAGAWGTLPDSEAAGVILGYDVTTNAWSTKTDDDVPEVSDFAALVGGSGIDNNSGTLDLDLTELNSATLGAGAFTAFTFNAGAVDPSFALSSGQILINGGGTAPIFGVDDEGQFRFLEEDGGGSNYIAFKAPAAITSDITITLENDANPIPDSAVGDGSDDDIPDAGEVDDTALAAGAVDGGTGGEIADGSVNADDLGTDSVNADELNATGVESELEAVIDLADLQGDLALGTKTSGNYVSALTAGAGLAVTHTPAEGSSGAYALDYSDQGANPALTADACQFTSNATSGRFIVCEGDTADTFETGIFVTDPTADRVFTIPNADSNPVQPITCSGTDKVSAISATGVITCTADSGASGGDSVTVNGAATADPDFDDSTPAAVSGTNVLWQYSAGNLSGYIPQSSATFVGVVELATTGEAETGTDTTRAVTPAGLLAGVSGKQTIYVPAGAMISETTTGCSSGTVETTTNQVMYSTKDCDGATQEGMQFMVGMPKSSDEGSLTFRVDWTASSGSGDVIWLLSCLARSNDDAIDTAFGTEVSVTDTVLTTGDVHQSPETGSVTPGGTWAEGDNLWCRLQRDADAAGDTLNAVDARVIGVRALYTTNAMTDD